MKCRIAGEQDIEYIKGILDRNFDEVMSKFHSKSILEKFKAHNKREDLLKQLNWKKVYVVEDDNGNIIATGAFANFGSKEKPKYSISNLYVIPEHHSKGIGKILFNALYEEAKSNHANSFHVPSSRNAVGFYEKMGFSVDMEQPEKDDEITWMTMQLPSEL